MGTSDHTDTPHDYDQAMIDVLQMLWGDGYLSPGGPEAVTEIVGGIDLANCDVLDVGCGAGGPDHVLMALGAATVTGVDVVPHLIEMAATNGAHSPHAGGLEFKIIEPEAPLPFADTSFDVVFTKDAWLHVIDKPDLLGEVHRVLRPGGRLAASDWLKGTEPYSNEMLYFIELEGIPYHQVTLDAYEEMLAATGFADIRAQDTTDWYAQLAIEEYDRLRGDLYDELTIRLGAEARDHFIENWRMLTVVTASGELRPGRFWATKPA